YGGTVVNTTAVNSHVTSSGDDVYAGIGGGRVSRGKVVNTMAVNSNVTTEGRGSIGGVVEEVYGGTVADTKAVNSFVNGNEKNFGSISNDQLLCQKADPRVLTASCSSRTEFLVALDLSVCQVNAATASTPIDIIDINDAETLGKIGRHPKYRLDGTYQQKADIVVTKDYQSIGNDSHPFTGEYDGQGRTISGLSDCFVDTLEGSIRDLHFTCANINSQKTTGLAACVVDVTGTVSNIRAKDVHIFTNGNQNYAGIGGGDVRGTVANTTAVNSHVTTSGYGSYAGIGGG
ncbi:hypothetical protein J7439_25645, partial [Salinisphaera sp. G21_0]